MSQTETRNILDSDLKIERKPVRGFLDDDDIEEAEVLGFLMYSTTGDMYVPRDWLQEQFQKHEIPMSLFPSDVGPWAAYRRAMGRLLEDGFDEIHVNGLKIEFDVKEGEENVRIVRADIFFSEERTGETGGHYRTVELGHFDYNEGMTHEARVDPEDEEVLYEQWKRFVGRAQGLLTEVTKVCHAQDMRKILLDLRKGTSSIMLRQAVYFYPASYGPILESLAKIWQQLYQFKDSGERTELTTAVFLDNEHRRRHIQRKAEELIEGEVDEAIEDGLDTLRESDEAVAEDIATAVVGDMSTATMTAEDYGDLLDVELSVKRHIRQWLNEVEGEKKELVESVIEEVELDEEPGSEDLGEWIDEEESGEDEWIWGGE